MYPGWGREDTPVSLPFFIHLKVAQVMTLTYLPSHYLLTFRFPGNYLYLHNRKSGLLRHVLVLFLECHKLVS